MPENRIVPRTGPKLRVKAVVAASLALPLVLVACGDDGDYPSETIEYIVPYNPGGGADPVGREFSSLLEDELDASVDVLNQPGGDESVGISQLANSDPDGYTLGLGTSGGYVAQPLINADAQYSGAEDFTPLAKMSGTPYGLFVAADSEYETLEDLLEAAAENPGEVSVSSPTGMGNPAFAVYFLEDQAEVEFTLVTTAGGTGEAALEVMSGRIDAVIGNASGQLGLVESGDLRAIAYSGYEDYSDFLPDTPSFNDLGYDIPFTSDYMTFAPADLDEDVEEILRDASESIVNSDAWTEFSANQGALPDVATGDELDAYLEEILVNIERGIELGNSRED